MKKPARRPRPYPEPDWKWLRFERAAAGALERFPRLKEVAAPQYCSLTSLPVRIVVKHIECRTLPGA